MSTRFSSLWVLMSGLAVSACGGSDGGDASPQGSGGQGATGGSAGSAAAGGTGGSAGLGGVGGVAGGGSGFEVADPEWGSCPSGFRDECALVEVPLDWNDPQGPTIEVQISRLKASEEPRRQLWMLQGGPGGSADVFDQLVGLLGGYAPDMDIFTLEHRGVGESTRLGCPDEEAPSSEGSVEITQAEWPDCIDHLEAEWGEGLAHFSTTQAARDLGGVIKATQQDGVPVFVHGTSYGTYWANRYLVLFPEQSSGAILDSIALPDDSLADFDLGFDAVGAELMQRCAADSLCQSKLGSDPLSRLAALYDALDAGHCAALGLDRALLRRTLGSLLPSSVARTWIGPLIYRLERCSDEDLQRISSFYNNVFGSGEGPASVPRFSRALQANITLSEIWESPNPDPVQMAQDIESSNFAQGATLYLAQIHDDYPRYAADEHRGQYASPDVPLLLLAGGLDPSTPLAAVSERAQEQWNGPNQHFLVFPDAAHGVTFGSPDLFPPGGKHCGVKLLLDFTANPEGGLDTTCLDHLAPADFQGYGPTSQAIWGTDDLWEG